MLNQTENERETASFTCQATGEPIPTISWYFNGVLLADGTILNDLLIGSKLSKL